MKKSSATFFGCVDGDSLWADDLTRAIQQRLKDQGFYYGEVNGQGGDETSAAIRRYQIRHGLKVTGQLNDETLHSLGMSRNSAAQPAPDYQENGGPPKGRLTIRLPATPGQPDDQYYRRTRADLRSTSHYRQPPRQYDGQPFPQSEGPEDYNQMQPPRLSPLGS